MSSTSFGEQFFMYLVTIIITIFFFISEVLLLFVYCKRKQWILQMTLTTQLSLYSFFHCLFNAIPISKEGWACSLSGAFHSSTLVSMVLMTDYFVFYAFLSFEKPEFVEKYRCFFVQFLISLVNILFIVISAVLIKFGDSTLDSRCLQCRIGNYYVRKVLEYYCIVLGSLSILLSLLLVVRVIMYLKSDENGSFLKEFISKMFLYGIGLVIIVLSFILYLIKEKYNTFGWIVSQKIIESLTCYVEFFANGFNKTLFEEIKNIGKKRVNNTLIESIFRETKNIGDEREQGINEF